ncbi:MAG: M28 family peptidase [Candidatus Aminicenantes bacterium]|nr:M28 family peptidase [Candidatus Aminicenantes bacterium]
MKKSYKILPVFLCVFFLAGLALRAQSTADTEEQKLLQVMHSISSHTLYDYVKELASDKYWGRLTGTKGFNDSASWVISHFEKWGLKPAGDDGTFLQAFPNPYTLVHEGCRVVLHLDVNGGKVEKNYHYYDEFIPGSTSDSGEVTAEVIYVGYGITAPELGYDDYAGVDVEGKIILMEREVPVSPNRDPELFKKWRPYSFHQYKLENAHDHGAKGMLYNYGPIGNPNNSFRKGFIYSHVGPAVVEDVFAGTGRKYQDVVGKIKETLKPQSFATGKTFTIKNVTEHFPEGTAYNVIGILEGSDPVLKDEVIILGGHLDHLGRCWEIMPGANDNASAVAVIMGIAEALSQSPVKPPRSVMFLCFGAEEQGVAGSDYYVKNPVVPLEKTAAFINMDGVGVGDKLSALASKDFPEFWAFIDRANQKYIHRLIRTSSFANIARPRLDAARFLWANVPSISFGASGGPTNYHTPGDNIDIITPEIMEDLAQMLYIAVLDMADEEKLDFRK